MTFIGIGGNPRKHNNGPHGLLVCGNVFMGINVIVYFHYINLLNLFMQRLERQ